jgi:manganese transport protein
VVSGNGAVTDKLAQTAIEPGWREPRVTPSLAEVYRSVPVEGRWWRQALAFAGPGYLVAVGYMDPGNWATDLAGGSRFGYSLLSVVLLSNLIAILLQGLAAKLGIATGRDLAQACRHHYSRPTNIVLWIICELAIAACDLAEVIGSAIGLNLLFGMPLPVGIGVTSLDVLIVLFLQHRGFRLLEALVIALILTIAGCFLFEILVSRPTWSGIMGGFLPTASLLQDKERLYIGMGILGATVMPHNLYLHSSVVQTRAYPETTDGRRRAIRFAFLDSTVALTFALGINAAILIVAAATFHVRGHAEVAEIQEAYRLLTPLLGVTGASTVFALALLASGQNSTLTGTLAGQIVMEGFLDLRIRPWLRRLITRLLAIVPAGLTAIFFGETGTAKLLILSQVILSVQLSFAVFPLVRFTSDRAKMGPFANPRWLKALAYGVAFAIAGLNGWLVWQLATGAAG